MVQSRFPARFELIPNISSRHRASSGTPCFIDGSTHGIAKYIVWHLSRKLRANGCTYPSRAEARPVVLERSLFLFTHICSSVFNRHTVVMVGSRDWLEWHLTLAYEFSSNVFIVVVTGNPVLFRSSAIVFPIPFSSR